MATAEEGKLIANANPSSSYGGSGAGGKFRRKAFRRQATPYDRPPSALRGNEQKSAGWLTKVFVDPAVKLISYGADRFFASVFRKRLPAQAPPQQPETNHCINDRAQEDGKIRAQEDVIKSKKDKETPEEPVGSECGHVINDTRSKGIFELEQLLKQCAFTRPQLVHLTELLQSKAIEGQLGHASKEREDISSDFGEHQQFVSPARENGSQVLRVSPVLTPHLSSVPENDFASPAEIAKAYMGGRASRASPSVLGVHRHIPRDEINFPTKAPLDFKSSTTPLTEKNSVSIPTFENRFAFRRSRGRSAISNIAGTPYTRGQSLVNVPSPSSLHSVGNYDLGSGNLKRRSTDIDDDFASVSSVRRTRQKPNLLPTQIHRSPFVEGLISNQKQKSESMDTPNNKVPVSALESGKVDAPSTSFAVPSRSSEVAAKILKKLEKLSPKEKSSEFKSHVGLQKSKLKLTATLKNTGRALRINECVDLPKLPLDMKNDKKLVDVPMHSLSASQGSLQQPENKKENNFEDSSSPLATEISDMNNDLSLKKSTTDSSWGNGESEPSKKRTFKMSAQEEFSNMDNNVAGPSSGAFPEKLGVMDSYLPLKGTSFMKTSIQPTLVPGVNGIKTREFGGSSVSGIGDKSFTFSSSEKTSTAPISETAPSSFGVVKETNLLNQLFSFSSKLDVTFQESKPENSISSNPAKAYANGNTATTPLATDEKLVSAPPALPSVTASSNDTQKSAASGFRFSSSADAADSVKSSTSSPFGNSIFGLNAASTSAISQKSTSSGFMFSSSTSAADIMKSSTTPLLGNGLFGFNAVSSSDIKSTGNGFILPIPATGADPVTSETSSPFENSIFGLTTKSSNSSESRPITATVPSAARISETTDFGTKAVANHSSGGAVSSLSFPPATGATTPGFLTSGFGSVNAFSSFPSVNTFSSSQAFSASSIFGSSAVASPFGTGAAASGSAQSSGVTKADTTAANMNSTAVKFTSGIAGSAISSDPSSSFEAAGSGTGGAAPIFKFNSSTSFGAGSSGSAPVNATASGSSSLFGGLGWSSAASSSVLNTLSSSNISSNIFGTNSQSSVSPCFGGSIPSFATSSTPSVSFSSSASTSSASAFSSTPFSFTSSPASFATSPSLPTQSIFGKPLTNGFTRSPGSGDQMNVEDTMAEDPVQSSPRPAFPIFGQPSASQPAPVPTFGSTPSQANPFVSFGQQNQAAFQQGSSSLETNASGGSFSLGSGGPEKSRKIVRISKTRNRKRA